MALTTKVYRSYLKQVISKYPLLAFTKPVQLPLVDPYNADNGKYVAFPQNSTGANLSSGLQFWATSFALTDTGSTMILSQTVFHWNSVGAGFSKIAIKQMMPDTTQIDCAVIDLGGVYNPDGVVDLDFTNSGFISFNSDTFIP